MSEPSDMTKESAAQFLALKYSTHLGHSLDSSYDPATLADDYMGDRMIARQHMIELDVHMFGEIARHKARDGLDDLEERRVPASILNGSFADYSKNDAPLTALQEALDVRERLSEVAMALDVEFTPFFMPSSYPEPRA